MARLAEATAILIALCALYVAAHFLLRSPTPLGGSEHRTKDYSMTLNPAAVSKINWAQAISLAAVLASVFGLDLTPERQAEVLAAIATITPTVTLIFRTFFTGKAAS